MTTATIPTQLPPPALPATYQLPAQLAAYAGDGSSVTPDSPNWSSSDQSMFTVVPSSDGLSAMLFGWKEGPGTLTVVASKITITIPIVVVPVPIVGPVAVGLVVTFGTPVAQPASGSGP